MSITDGNEVGFWHKLGNRRLGHRPPPPPMPYYSAEDEAPKWNWSRVVSGLPVDKGPIPFTKTGTQPDSPDKPDWRGVIRNNVIELPRPGAYEYGQPVDLNYFWFDTPDYADPFKKLWYSVKFFTKTGIMASCAIALTYGYDCTTASNLKLFRICLGPWLIGGFFAGASVIAVANLRGKVDDYYNYLPAGFIMGTAFGRNCPARWFRWTALMVPTSIIVKHNAEINGCLAPGLNVRTHGLALDSSAENGFSSGDWRFGYRGNNWGDPGRDLRRVN